MFWPELLLTKELTNKYDFLEKHLILPVLLFISVNHESRSQSSVFELWNLKRLQNQIIFDWILWFEDDTGTFIISLGDPPGCVAVMKLRRNWILSYNLICIKWWCYECVTKRVNMASLKIQLAINLSALFFKLLFNSEG